MKNKTILVVDDTISNLDIMGVILDKYDVMDATSGKDALEILDEEQIDLILLDIMMPDMNGYEVCEILKANPKTKDIPIIFITAKTDENSIEKAYDVGGIDYVTKPFKPKELLARVKTQLHVQNLQNELRVLASTDPMTKLYNRRYFTKVSAHALDLAKKKFPSFKFKNGSIVSKTWNRTKFIANVVFYPAYSKGYILTKSNNHYCGKCNKLKGLSCPGIKLLNDSSKELLDKRLEKLREVKTGTGTKLSTKVPSPN